MIIGGPGHSHRWTIGGPPAIHQYPAPLLDIAIDRQSKEMKIAKTAYAPKKSPYLRIYTSMDHQSINGKRKHLVGVRENVFLAKG